MPGLARKQLQQSTILPRLNPLAFVVFIGISNACGILVGKQDRSRGGTTVFTYARRTLIIATIGALLMGLVIMLFADHVLAFYRVKSPEVKEYARRILLVISLTLWDPDQQYDDYCRHPPQWGRYPLWINSGCRDRSGWLGFPWRQWEHLFSTCRFTMFIPW